MPTGKGRGDGDRGSGVNYHIGYLDILKDSDDKNVSESDGTANVKPYIRTGPKGRRVKSGDEIVDFDLHRYFIKRATKEENEVLAAAEYKDLKKWKAVSSYYGAYIKIAEISEDDDNAGDLEEKS